MIKNKASPYAICVCRLSKVAAIYNRNLTKEEIDKCEKDAFVSDDNSCITKMLD